MRLDEYLAETAALAAVQALQVRKVRRGYWSGTLRSSKLTQKAWRLPPRQALSDSIDVRQRADVEERDLHSASKQQLGRRSLLIPRPALASAATSFLLWFVLA